MASRTGNTRRLSVRNRYYLLADLLLIPLVVVLSFWLRLDLDDLQPYLPTMLAFAALAVVIKPTVLYLFGLYRRYWRYASMNDMLHLVLAVLIASVLTALLMYTVIPLLVEMRSLPRSVPILDCLISLALIAGLRYSERLLANYQTTAARRTQYANNGSAPMHRVLVMGAGDAGSMVVREIQANPGLGLTTHGLLDDDRSKVGMTIHGVPVRGTREDIPLLVKSEQIDEIIIAMPTAPGTAIRDIVKLCKECGVACKTVPGIYELLSGQVSVRQLREVRIEDLLRREPVRMDDSEAGRYLAHRTVLVTGAGGSIGAELCRQIARYPPRQLLLLGHGENSIYHIALELRERFPTIAVQSLIADVRDERRIENVFAQYQPEVVFHTAAHKHVPLMEANPTEAVLNNVFGTRNLLRSAERHGVSHFVFVSTDKAVNPVSMMGATKRLAEILVQDAAEHAGRPFVAVRFGNVLGSRGSVVPLFQRQIASGGPVTVTHPEMRRYFMTIPEAVQLIIQAGAIGRPGEILVLDMGEPVLVVDLATELIRLCGFEPGRDIEIVFAGPRPGEKLNEALFAEGEVPRPTQNSKILVAQGNNHCDHSALERLLDELEAVAQEGNPTHVITKVRQTVLELQPPREQRSSPAESGPR